MGERLFLCSPLYYPPLPIQLTSFLELSAALVGFNPVPNLSQNRSWTTMSILLFLESPTQSFLELGVSIPSHVSLPSSEFSYDRAVTSPLC